MSEPDYERQIKTPRLNRAPRAIERPFTGFGIAALSFGILGVILVWVPVVALLMSFSAVVFAAIAIRQVRNMTRRGGGVAAAGLIFGITGLLMLAALLIIGALVS